MQPLHLPWLTLCIVLPILGAIRVAFTRDPDTARRQTLVASGLVLICAGAAWWEFISSLSSGAQDRGDPLMARLLHPEMLTLDELSAPLLPLAALISFLTNLATLRTKVREVSFARSLAAEAILLATLSCKLPWGVAALLAAGTIPPSLELRKSHKPRRVYFLHMGLFVVLLGLGQALLAVSRDAPSDATLAIVLLTAAVLLRSGVVPVHCWLTDLFEHSTFGTALLFVTPMVGVYGVARLVLPVAPPWILQVISLASIVTAVYAAGMALVQREARRFFAYLFLSQSSLVLVGIETATPIGLTGALSLWLSVGLALTGFGLTLRCVEFRAGRILLTNFRGLYQHVPMLATLFLLTGLASIGFPGTVGFVGLELLVDGAVQAAPLTGAIIVIVTALNGLAVMRAYFRIFGGKPHVTSVDLRVRRAERISVLVLTALILGGGLYPQPGVTSRYHAAIRLFQARGREVHQERGQGAAVEDQRIPSRPPPDRVAASRGTAGPIPLFE